MGISIKGKGGGARVTIDGKPVNKKLTLSKEWVNLYKEVINQKLCPEPSNIVQLDENLFAFSLQRNNGPNKDDIYIFKYDNEKRNIKSCIIREFVSSYYFQSAISSGYKNKKMYSMTKYGTSESIFNGDFSNPSFTGTSISNVNFYSTFIDRKYTEKIYYSDDRFNLGVIDKVSGEKTELGRVSLPTQNVSRNAFFGYDKKIYIACNKNGETNLICFDINKKETTELFKFHEKFNINDDPYFIISKSVDTDSISILEDGKFVFSGVCAKYTTVEHEEIENNYIFRYFGDIEKDMIKKEYFLTNEEYISKIMNVNEDFFVKNHYSVKNVNSDTVSAVSIIKKIFNEVI